MKTMCLTILACSLICSLVYADFEQVTTIPRAVTRPYGNISAVFLHDGRLVVWDGNGIYLQPLPGAAQVYKIASGYIGDTAFMALSPDGHTLLLGGGMSGNLYKFDMNAPADYSNAAVVRTIPHYWGAFLNDTLVVVDKLADISPTDELAVMDISQPNPELRVVISKPAEAQVPVGGFAASAALAVDTSGTWLYTMEALFDSSFMVVENPLKRIPVSDIIAAYNASSTLNWDDYAAIGSASATGGPVAVTVDGDVLLAGFGGVQRVDGETGALVETYNPGGMVYHGAAYDASTDSVYPLATDTAQYTMDLFYAPAGEFQALPVGGAASIVSLVLLTCVAFRRTAGK